MSQRMSVEEKKQHIVSILPENATLIDFSYDAVYFGNHIVRIKKEEMIHTFITDRGEIYHNNVMLCDSSYHDKGKEDIFPKLLAMIYQEMHK